MHIESVFSLFFILNSMFDFFVFIFIFVCVPDFDSFLPQKILSIMSIFRHVGFTEKFDKNIHFASIEEGPLLSTDPFEHQTSDILPEPISFFDGHESKSRASHSSKSKRKESRHRSLPEDHRDENVAPESNFELTSSARLKKGTRKFSKHHADEGISRLKDKTSVVETDSAKLCSPGPSVIDESPIRQTLVVPNLTPPSDDEGGIDSSDERMDLRGGQQVDWLSMSGNRPQSHEANSTQWTEEDLEALDSDHNLDARFARALHDLAALDRNARSSELPPSNSEWVTQGFFGSFSSQEKRAHPSSSMTHQFHEDSVFEESDVSAFGLPQEVVVRDSTRRNIRSDFMDDRCLSRSSVDTYSDTRSEQGKRLDKSTDESQAASESNVVSVKKRSFPSSSSDFHLSSSVPLIRSRRDRRVKNPRRSPTDMSTTSDARILSSKSSLRSKYAEEHDEDENDPPSKVGSVFSTSALPSSGVRRLSSVSSSPYSSFHPGEKTASSSCNSAGEHTDRSLVGEAESMPPSIVADPSLEGRSGSLSLALSSSMQAASPSRFQDDDNYSLSQSLQDYDISLVCLPSAQLFVFPLHPCIFVLFSPSTGCCVRWQREHHIPFGEKSEGHEKNAMNT